MKYLLFIVFNISGLFTPQSKFLTEQIWLQDIDEAYLQSKSENKSIMMVFSGSDWCKPCIRLKNNIWESEVFQKFATENLILLEVDFPASRKNKLSKEQTMHNESLAEIYNPQGAFPNVVLLNHSGEVLSTFGSTSTWDSEDYINHIQGIISK